MKDCVNVAVIGAGYWGKKVIQEYLNLNTENTKVNISMICDLQDENLEQCNSSFGIPTENLTKDYTEVLKSKDVEAVHICTSNETHYQICKEALESNKHVLLEKPMTLNSKRASELNNIAETRNLILQVGFIFRYNNALRKIRTLLKKKYFGDLYYLKLQWKTLTEHPYNRDIISDLAPHPIDIINYLMDDWPQKIFCKGKAYRRNSYEDVAYIIAELHRGIMIHIELSWLQPEKTRRTDIIASKRCATVDCLKQIISINNNFNDHTYSIDVQKNNTILSEVSNFIEHIIKNEKYTTWRHIGVKNVEIMEYIRRSLDEERTITIPSGRWKL